MSPEAPAPMITTSFLTRGLLAGANFYEYPQILVTRMGRIIIADKAGGGHLKLISSKCISKRSIKRMRPFMELSLFVMILQASAACSPATTAGANEGLPVTFSM